MAKPKPTRPKRKTPQSQNPIEAAVTAWLDRNADDPSTSANSDEPQDRSEAATLLCAQAPKRWVVYEPMVLLPAGSFTSPAWREILDAPQGLWKRILAEISKKTRTTLTHLAVNEGIPLLRSHPRDARRDGISERENEGDVEEEKEEEEEENILRSPSGLRMLYGDFGPEATASPESGIPDTAAADFERAFWVSTRQNGIYQTWAPRWTMFSRGNIKEKARVLGFPTTTTTTFAHDDDITGHDNDNRDDDDNSGLAQQQQHQRGGADPGNPYYAVDLYAGIGYFAFSYAKLGMKVLCWELNPWSVEGLRRGARANGWGVRVVRPGDPTAADVEGSQDEAEEEEEEACIVVFQEDNRFAGARIAELRRRRRRSGSANGGSGINILHVNCGLLPTSIPVWRDAWEMVRPGAEAWLHLHENVGVVDIEKRRGEIESWFGALASSSSSSSSNEEEANRQKVAGARVVHVEMVKTFAPGVWHCVFDLYITRSSSSSSGEDNTRGMIIQGRCT
ncbi:S-adenosyl-L-methionine-dependent methyltransferase [Xylariomycetidae sp. FL2044]|nr:S-adenosyl-L-methionine-dependent methyltransferase [Xylariomycetidae sp. FL2044]